MKKSGKIKCFVVKSCTPVQSSSEPRDPDSDSRYRTVTLSEIVPYFLAKLPPPPPNVPPFNGVVDTSSRQEASPISLDLKFKASGTYDMEMAGQIAIENIC